MNRTRDSLKLIIMSGSIKKIILTWYIIEIKRLYCQHYNRLSSQSS